MIRTYHHLIKQIDESFQRKVCGIDIANTQMSDSQNTINYLLRQKTYRIYFLKLYNSFLDSQMLTSMSHARWDNLLNLYLGDNKLGNKGCKYVSKIIMPNLLKVTIQKNEIQSNGILHLAKAQWQDIEIIELDKNKIGNDGIKYLSRARWNKAIKRIYLNSNKLTVEETLRIILYQSTFIILLQFRQNNNLLVWSQQKLLRSMEERFDIKSPKIQL